MVERDPIESKNITFNANGWFVLLKNKADLLGDVSSARALTHDLAPILKELGHSDLELFPEIKISIPIDAANISSISLECDPNYHPSEGPSALVRVVLSLIDQQDHIDKRQELFRILEQFNFQPTFFEPAPMGYSNYTVILEPGDQNPIIELGLKNKDQIVKELANEYPTFRDLENAAILGEKDAMIKRLIIETMDAKRVGKEILIYDVAFLSDEKRFGEFAQNFINAFQAVINFQQNISGENLVEKIILEPSF